MKENANLRLPFSCSPADYDVQMAPVNLYLAENNEKCQFHTWARGQDQGKLEEVVKGLLILFPKHPIRSDPSSIKMKSRRKKKEIHSAN